jgi:phospholipase/carboxylesterase
MSSLSWSLTASSREPRLSRREALLAAIASSAWACQAGDVAGGAPRRAAAASSASARATAPANAGDSSASKPGGLDVVRLGPSEEEKGGTLVVLLHGWRAQGNDLLGLARELAHSGARFLVPAAPLAEPGGGRAWWRLDTADRPAHAWKDELPPDYRPNAAVAAARQAVQAVLRDAKQRYAPDAIALVGFSQGAMLALDVALAADPPVDRVAVLSGVLIADALPALHVKKAALPAVFVSHGRSDPVLPFAGGASIETVLAPHGYRVKFVPFEGGHEIPPPVVEQLRTFLFAGLR